MNINRPVALRSFAASINLCALSLFLLLCPSLQQPVIHAQDLDDVSISGRVIDPNGAVVPDVVVTARLTSTETERVVTTDIEGRYRFTDLAPGAYTILAHVSGFNPVLKNIPSTIAGQNVQLDLHLQLAELVPTYLQVVEAPLIDTTRTIIGGTVTAEEMESLPTSTRTPLDFIFTLPGTTEEPLSTRDTAEDRNTSTRATPEEAGAFTLSGGAAYSNNLTIDGLDNNDDRAARERFQPSLEAVEEVQVIRNQFSAEYGRASGGRVNLRTRGGANRFRGRAFYFFRDESLKPDALTAK